MTVMMEITSKQMIKPSSPTPNQLRNLKLSFLDQIAPPIHTPLIFFYQLPTQNIKDRCEILASLKQSLSSVLTRFYPLAGRLCMENYTIDCNDSGALLVEANIHANLMEVIKDPAMDELRRYLPLGNAIKDASTLLLAVQITLFDCGGIAVSIQISHMIADGTSMVHFMNAWAAVCRGDDDFVYGDENFDLVDLFPPKDLSSFKPSGAMVNIEKMVTKRFVFDKEQLAKMMHAESSSGEFKDPTRVEAVSAFFWRRFIALARAKGSKKMISAYHAVNLRPRMDPPLPNHTFGNVWRHCEAEAGDDDDLVGGLRNAVRNIDGDYVKKIRVGSDEYLSSVNRTLALISRGELERCKFSSWLRFPVYEVDYGWGRPAWVSTTTLPFKNVVILMGTRSGDGMEAWVNLHEEDATHDFMNINS